MRGGKGAGVLALLVGVLVLSISTTTLAATWYVDAGPPGGNGTLASPYALAQDAVNAAAPGDTIIINGGGAGGVQTISNLNKGGLNLDVESPTSITAGDVSNPGGTALTLLVNAVTTIGPVRFHDSITGLDFTANATIAGTGTIADRNGTGIKGLNNALSTFSGGSITNNGVGIVLTDNGAAGAAGVTFGGNGVHFRSDPGGITPPDLAAFIAANTFLDGAKISGRDVIPIPPPPPQFFQLQVSSEGCGSVQTDLAPTTLLHIMEETVVALRATPNIHCRFVGWEGEGVKDSHSLTTSVSMVGNRKVVGRFEEIMHTLTVAEPQGKCVMSPAPGSYTLLEGTKVNFSCRTEGKDWVFDHWVGPVEGDVKVAGTSILINSDMTVGAVLAPMGRTLTVTAPVGQGKVSLAPGIYKAYIGDTIILYGWPAEGYSCSWTGPVAHSDRCATYVAIGDADVTVGVTFTKLPSAPPPPPSQRRSRNRNVLI